jgi:hypothetical protein
MLLPANAQHPLRDAFARYAPGTPPLENVLMVGAALDDRCRLSPQDTGYLRRALEVLESAGGGLSRDFRVSALTLDTRYNAFGDFLSGGHKADLLVYCYLYNPPSPEMADMVNRDACLTSPLHFAPGIWHDRAVETGARAVFVVGGEKMEICKKHLEREDSPLRLFRAAKEDVAAGVRGRPADTALFLRRDYAPGR